MRQKYSKSKVRKRIRFGMRIRSKKYKEIDHILSKEKKVQSKKKIRPSKFKWKVKKRRGLMG